MIFTTIQRSLHSKWTSILYEKYFYSALLRYQFSITRENIHPTQWNSDGVSFGTHFSNFYMSVLENKGFNSINRPNIYLRYAKVKLLTNSTDEIKTIQETFQNNFVLIFTQEINANNKILFLGLLIDTSNMDPFTTSTYKKPTNINPCTLNFHSECSFRYKRTIIKTLISTTFRPICPPAFLRCLSNLGTCTELRTTSFIESTGVACSDSVCHNQVFFSSSFLNYWFPYCIQLYTWSTQQDIVAQHMCWFLKASNLPMFSLINFFNFIP